MACNRQPGAAPVCAMVEELTGWKITQNEWHELRQMAKENGHTISRERADADRIDNAMQALTRELAGGLLDEGAGVDEAAKRTAFAGVNARTAMERASVTRGTVGIVNLIAEKGVVDTRADLAKRMGKTPKAPAAPTVDPKVEAEREQRFTSMRRVDMIRVRQDSEMVADATRQLMWQLDGEDNEYLNRVANRLIPAVNDVHLEYGQSTLAEQTRANLRDVYEQLRGTANAFTVNYNHGSPVRGYIDAYLQTVTVVIAELDQRGEALRKDAPAA